MYGNRSKYDQAYADGWSYATKELGLVDTEASKFAWAYVDRANKLSGPGEFYGNHYSTLAVAVEG